jgi:hypothetical protein
LRVIKKLLVQMLAIKTFPIWGEKHDLETILRKPLATIASN